MLCGTLTRVALHPEDASVEWYIYLTDNYFFDYFFDYFFNRALLMNVICFASYICCRLVVSYVAANTLRLLKTGAGGVCKWLKRKNIFD